MMINHSDTIVFEQEQQMKNEEEKAMIHARAQAAVERENHELRMEQTRAEAKEMGKAQTKISEIQSEFFYKNLGRILSNEDNMLVNTAVSLGGIAIAGIITYKSMSELMRQVAARTSTPNLGNFFHKSLVADFFFSTRNFEILSQCSRVQTQIQHNAE